jgi:hypothetical protein
MASHGAACGGEAVNPRLNPTCALGKKNHTWSFRSRILCIVPCEYTRLKSMGKWLHIMKAGVVSTVLSTLGDSESGPNGQKDTIKTSRTCT